MTQHKPITGLAWHLHHDVLIEWCYDYEQRVAAITTDKPLSEQPTRLRLFQMVKAPPAKYIAARTKLDAARIKYDAAGDKYTAARDKYAAAGNKYDAARITYTAARKKYAAAGYKYAAAGSKYNAVRAEYDLEILALHVQECPDCPWDGTTIFAKEGEA